MTRYLSLPEYLWLAEQVTGVSATVLASSDRVELADSALHAPAGYLNGGRWDPDPPDVDEAERAMLGVASGEIDELVFSAWLRTRIRFHER